MGKWLILKKDEFASMEVYVGAPGRRKEDFSVIVYHVVGEESRAEVLLDEGDLDRLLNELRLFKREKGAAAKIKSVGL